MRLPALASAISTAISMVRFPADHWADEGEHEPPALWSMPAGKLHDAHEMTRAKYLDFSCLDFSAL